VGICPTVVRSEWNSRVEILNLKRLAPHLPANQKLQLNNKNDFKMPQFVSLTKSKILRVRPL
jgi:hypothetical protein